MKTILKAIITLFSVIYPFGIVFFREFSFYLLIIMAILWGLRGILEFGYESENLSEFGKFSFVLCGFFALCAVFSAYGIKYLYPVLINAFLGAVFYFSLASTPMITKFAMLKEKNLEPKALIYTRNLTKIWIGFFVINGLVSAILACFENKIYWGVYCGAISYVFIGILFFGEIIFRKFYIKNA
ncbi:MULTISPECIES: DNA gyrase subunit B [unclassified Campylobacter]|uniref:COG4648 family protein n=1 Tax=unclassified Campylobacter TaxID=2593542 RepID=UPI0022E9B97F|nr:MULTISPECIES: DNA gyrase subunit B [unclassified Campylobacter]MDA3081206.1 DNA gyrase subunit B [Campylobacter sp. CS_NA1]MDA3085757.1 DNA gyrase subunit B [Campylobacter sp. CS_ED1]MDA3090195.1 DNA gyrase subunit B [Campylobacter sp. CS_ED2]